ncbi:alpha-amylase [Corynebacterium sp. 13CS0277]|uniref:alpha-amylase family protein n=1 Tax=Corynebacterium sp. 13CS0277 TaxID=2071994 RepID=UPI000D02DD0B|nr:alpha-amylase family protein [Corynebacterium sp. 13CS0277]PRQ12474.1 alpha-amylase [Corynebacterium sp. 13CS0277]
MSFSDHAILWHVYPLGFVGAPIRGERHPAVRWPHLSAWLDYAQSLGTNVVQLGPVFSSRTHGYDTVDFFTIDDRLGGEEDFAAFLAAAGERGLQVVLDGVFNHVAAGGPLDRPELVRDTVFEGHGDLKELDHSRDEVVDLVAEVMIYWLDRGVRGWRLDAAYAVPAEFWARVLPRVRAAHPEAWFVGEMIHGDYVQYVADSGLDSVTQYELWKAIWSSLKDRNFFELAWSLQRHNDFVAHFRPMTFVGNHDVTRIATQVGAAGSALAHTVLFTVGGVPEVYYGDEQGFTGEKFERLGGDDEVRPAFPHSPEELSPLGEPLLRWVRTLIGVRRRHPWLVDARVEEIATTNDTFHYAVVGREQQRLEVYLDGAQGTARISDGQTTLAQYP